MSRSPDFLNFAYRLSRLRISRLISWVIQGSDDLPRISLDGIHSRVSLSKVVGSLSKVPQLSLQDGLIGMTLGRVSFWL